MPDDPEDNVRVESGATRGEALKAGEHVEQPSRAGGISTLEPSHNLAPGNEQTADLSSDITMGSTEYTSSNNDHVANHDAQSAQALPSVVGSDTIDVDPYVSVRDSPA
jgi:hypothetical protein